MSFKVAQSIRKNPKDGGSTLVADHPQAEVLEIGFLARHFMTDLKSGGSYQTAIPCPLGQIKGEHLLIVHNQHTALANRDQRQRVRGILLPIECHVSEIKRGRASGTGRPILMKPLVR